MLNYSIVNTCHDDLPFIYSLFDDAFIYQRQNGFPDWKDYSKEALKEDIDKKRQFKILVNGQIACIFTTCMEDHLVWNELELGNSIYLHRIVANKHFKGLRLVGKIVSFTNELCKKKGRSKIRLDTWANNESIIDYYKSFGFKIIRYSFNPDTPELPIQMRGNKVVLMEYDLA